MMMMLMPKMPVLTLLIAAFLCFVVVFVSDFCEATGTDGDGGVENAAGISISNVRYSNFPHLSLNLKWIGNFFVLV